VLASTLRQSVQQCGFSDAAFALDDRDAAVVQASLERALERADLVVPVEQRVNCGEPPYRRKTRLAASSPLGQHLLEAQVYKGLLAAILATLALAAPAHALEPPPDCPRPVPKWDGESPRVVEGTSGAGPTADSYLAVLPEGYRSDPARRYPVVYLLHGMDSIGDEYLTCIRLLELTADDQVIVVLPQGTPFGFWIDWHSGEQMRESALLEMIDAVDRRFRTVADRSGRAIGGLSMGGYGAMVQAARHPELYAAAASFSGALDSADSRPGEGELVYALETGVAPGAFAPPTTPEGREWRTAHDPASLAERLRGKWLFLSSGNGVPCDPDEARRFGELDPSYPVFEPLFRTDHDRLAAALETARIAHISRRYECGAHTFRTFQRGLEEAWPGLLTAIGAINVRFTPARAGLHRAVARSGSETASLSIRAVGR